MGTQQAEDQRQIFGCWHYGDTVVVEADYDGTPLREPKHITLVKPEDNPIIKAAVLAERERCASLADEWEMRETGKYPTPYGLGAEIRKGK